MKPVRLAGAAVLMTPIILASFGAVPRFEKVSYHCYFLRPASGGSNIGAVITNGGVLLINPPAQPDLAGTLEALKRVTPKSVTWVVNTDYRLEKSGGSARIPALDAAIIASQEQRQLVSSAVKVESKEPPGTRRDDKSPVAANLRGEAEPRLYFTRQMRLFPENVEIRIAALASKSLTSGDIVVFVPAEKVLYLGGLFLVDSFPEIDRSEGEGTALGWIDGIRRVVEMVPLLKSAMPQPRPDPSKPQPEEKTLEELVTVIPGSGGRSNLRELKDLLESAHRLRNEISKAVSSGRTRENFLFLGTVSQYHGHPNFETFATQLYDELAAQKAKSDIKE